MPIIIRKIVLLITQVCFLSRLDDPNYEMFSVVIGVLLLGVGYASTVFADYPIEVIELQLTLLR